MGIRILGVSLGTIILIILVAVAVRKWGGSIPLIKNV